MSTLQDDVNGVEPSTSTLSEPFQEEQTMLILVGLIASGKSTFAQALESHFPRFRRCNQDDLGTRQHVEELAYQTLQEGRSPCIDRTNFNETQRSYWTAIARAFPGTSISIIVFDIPYHVCASRLKGRAWHPTVRDAQHGMAILQKFASDFSMPSPEEGYDYIIYLRPEDHPRPEYTREDVLSILQRLKVSTRDAANSVIQRSIQQPYSGRSEGYFRAGHTRGSRGGGRGYRGFSPARGSLYNPSWSTGRVRGIHSSNWRRSGPGQITNLEGEEGPDRRQAEAATASVPPMESSKTRGSAEARHNSS